MSDSQAPVQRTRRVATLALPIAAMALAGLLRLDAITQSYGPVDSPRWLRTLQNISHSALGPLRPTSIGWEQVGMHPHRDGPPSQYISDPYTYLIFARERRSIYQAHHREPVFPVVTKAWLWLLNDRDVAVSFASASFSVLAVFAAYLLGAALSGRGVGFAAAIAMAIDYDVISWSIGGWRDDAFTFAVVMSAWAMIRYLKMPSLPAAIVLGGCAGVACLTRLTAVTFLVPGFACLFAVTKAPLKARAAGMLAALLTLMAVAGPFVVNCWRAYGDPLYAINYLTHDQLLMEAQLSGTASTTGASTSAREYVVSKVTTRPLQTLETVALGLTSYPFSNKWHGLNRWISRLGDLLSLAAIAGMLLLASSTPGRLVLLVLATSLIPAAITWRLAADWRFTGHAYPFFLVAACLALGRLARVRPSEIGRRGWPSLRFVGVWTAGMVVIGGAVWFVTRALPFLVVGESLRAHDAVTIGTGDRDDLFFREGWRAPVSGGNVTLRAAAGTIASIRLPLPVADYLLTVRLDPFPRPTGQENEFVRPPVVRVFMNNRLLSTLKLGWNPERVGSYDVEVPRTALRRGINRLIFMSDTVAPALSGGPPSGAFAIWYVRIRPAFGS